MIRASNNQPVEIDCEADEGIEIESVLITAQKALLAIVIPSTRTEHRHNR